jgi:hypothetical protein
VSCVQDASEAIGDRRTELALLSEVPEVEKQQSALSIQHSGHP